MLELLEDRTVLSSYTAATVADLIADIKTRTPRRANTITLAPCKTFTLTSPDVTNASNGLPTLRPGTTDHPGQRRHPRP